MSLRRREFLCIAGAGAISAPAWAARPTVSEFSAAAGASGTLAIHYWPDSARMVDLQAAASQLVNPRSGERWPTGLVRSEQIPAGDGRLADTGIELTIWGLTPAASGVRPLRDASASIRFGTAPGGAIFQAWAQSDGTVLNEGRVITFRVPIERERGLEMGISLVEARSPGSDLARRLLGRLVNGQRANEKSGFAHSEPDWIRLAIESDSDTPKLQRGLYLISHRDSSLLGSGTQHLAISIEGANSSDEHSASIQKES